MNCVAGPITIKIKNIAKIYFFKRVIFKLTHGFIKNNEILTQAV